MNKLSVAATLVSVIALTQASKAHAQTATAESTVDEVVVTAMKRSESLQDVPAAVSVVDSSRLQEQGVTELTQVSKLTSGLSITPLRSQAFVFIRGVGQALTSPNADSSVAVNLDGVFLPAEIAGTAFFDVERVEVLPGPQGTLYGRNSTGGVLNITSRTPGDTYAANGMLELGNYERVHALVGVDIPLAEGLRSRTAAQIVRHDGYFNNGEDDQDNFTVRQTLVFEPSDRTRLSGAVTYSQDGGIGNVLQNIPFQECGARCSRFDPKALGYYSDIKTWTVNGRVDHELNDNLTLTYIGGYGKLDLDTKNSIFTGPPPGPLQILMRIRSQSHEVRLNADYEKWHGIAGLYYFDQSTFMQVDARPNPAQHRINPFDGPAEGAAVFGQGTYSVSDTLRLTGGIRYSRTTKEIDGFNSTFNAANVRVEYLPFSGKTTDGRIDWKLGVEYDLADSSMLYGSISTGYTPGGFSTAPVSLTSTQARGFDPVYLRAYAAGLKNRFADGRVTLNLEGYYYDYTNYQVSSRDIITGLNFVFNADKATIYGAQADAQFAITPQDTLTASATYLHAVADRLRAGALNLDGFTLPYSPKWTVNLFYQHVWDVGGGAELRGSANFKYTSSRWALFNHPPSTLVEGETTTSLNFGYFAPEDRWSLQAFVRNLEDNLVKTTCGNVLPPAQTGCFYEPPRTYGATLNFRF